ncbi:MAG: transcription termination factor NusA [Oscillospiraceae bacterium]|nr:transcription termination factor NusA [Oscillospiraceae bacterium]
MNNSEFYEALELLEKEKGIKKEYMLEKIKAAIIAAVKKERNLDMQPENIDAEFDEAKRKVRFFVRKEVVDEVVNPQTQIYVEEAKKISKKYKSGDTAEVNLDTKNFGRIAAKVGKNVIVQGINEAVYGSLAQEFTEKQGEIVTGVVERIDLRNRAAVLSVGRYEMMLPVREMIPREVISEGNSLKVYVADVTKKENAKGKVYDEVILSRKHPGLVRRLFELEVPEIADGTVEVMSVAREAGSRTKIAVMSNDADVDPVGACIGPKRSRISNIIEEIKGEKIDIIKYNSDPALFVSAALSPAVVLSAEADEKKKTCSVIVSDDQLSLAIGKEGQNARLAAKLTGWRIDIKSQSQAESEAAEAVEAAETETPAEELE